MQQQQVHQHSPIQVDIKFINLLALGQLSGGKQKMAHFAELNENNVVTNVVRIHNDCVNNLSFPESESVGIEYLKSISSLGSNRIWKQTSYNHNFRKRYAGIGCTYNSELNAFILPKPYPSWILNTETADWEAPVPQPSRETADDVFNWDEQTLSWVLVQNE
jgi:hypothetical protein